MKTDITDTKTAEERIYLQVDGDWYDESITWCVDQINDTDVEYVLATKLTRQEAIVTAALEWRENCSSTYYDDLLVRDQRLLDSLSVYLDPKRSKPDD